VKTIIIIISTFIVFIQIQSQEITRPKIIKTIPEYGDCDVDTSLREVLVVFDQEMNTGMSVVDSRHMPEITSRPQWIDSKTFSIPVKLEQDRLYNLQFNNARFKNFRNINGNALLPTELIFKTKGSEQKDLTKENEESYQLFYDHFFSYYSYKDLKCVSWENEFNNAKKELINAKSSLDFALKLNKILTMAHDEHIYIIADETKIYPYERDFIKVNYNFMGFLRNLSEIEFSPKRKVSAGKIGKSIGYIAITTWDVENEEDILSVIELTHKFRDIPNLIIDVRMNSGGSDLIAQKIAGQFTKEKVLYEKVKRFNPETKLFDKEQERYLNPADNNFSYTGKIYVLIGEQIMSSNESFVLMMKAIPNVKLVGETTRGSSGNPQEIKLPNGVSVMLPSWQACLPDGKCFEGVGIEPDIKIEFPEEEFRKYDPLLGEITKRLYPEFVDIRKIEELERMAWNLMEQQKLEEALEITNKVLEMDNSSTNNLDRKSRILLILNRPEEAYECAKKLNDSLPSNTLLKAQILDVLGQREEALEYYNRTLEDSVGSTIKGAAECGLDMPYSIKKKVPHDPSVKDESISKNKWIVHTNRQNRGIKNCIDNDFKTRWTNFSLQKPGEFIVLDLGENTTISRVVLIDDANGNSIYKDDYTRDCNILISLDKENWTEVNSEKGSVMQYAGAVFSPREARYIKIEQNGYSEKEWWSIYEIEVFSPK
jgi:tetratricopeptide (TPR) repeat protein